uniref:Aspartate aminotransferase n=1 Tax=Angomonas desouzai TaxID=59800 RepID=U5KM28_9TRYP|nr:mitochondrial aspartate transaminase [Angomonas desouzai]
MRRTLLRKSSFFSHVEKAPPDSILGLSTLYAADTHPHKVNLAVGVYRDGAGKPFVLESVKKAGAIVLQDKQMDYAPINGLRPYIESTQKLCFGAEPTEPPLTAMASLQTLSGTGALSLGAQLLHQQCGVRTVHVPQPTYPNHSGIFGLAGVELKSYPYYNGKTHQIDTAKMLDYFNQLEKHSVVLLHACAHNPTGCDLTESVLREVVAVAEKKQLVVFVDMAYQGFASGDIHKDGLLPRLLLGSKVPSFLIAQSFAKNFGLYGHRAGALHIQCASPEEKETILSRTATLVRPSYSNPPLFGARVVDTILRDADLRSLWQRELKVMSDRLSGIRRRLGEALREAGCTRDFSHLETGTGMMSLTGLTEKEVLALREQHHIYMTLNGRLAFSGLTEENVRYVAEKIYQVTK